MSTTFGSTVAQPPTTGGSARGALVPATGSRPVSASALVAALGVVLIAADIDLAAGLTAGTLLTLGLSPVWLPAAARSRGFRWLGVLTVVGVGTGVLLTGLAAGHHATSTGILVEQVLVLVGMVSATGWYLWARRHLPDWGVAALFAVGLLASIRPGSGLFAENPWKFGFSLPVAILALALAWRSGSRWLAVVLAVAMGAASAVTDGRSMFAMLLLTSLLMVWQGRRTDVSRPRSVVRVLLLAAGLVVVAYSVGQSLILEGYLGTETQLRSEEQLRTSGSLILGGRPEAAASVALIQQNPMGYGAGTIPSLQDILVAKAAMAGINYDPNNGYVENYMFGGHFEVHSMLGDLWIWYGPAGAALALAVLAISVHGLAGRIAGRTASALIIFLVARTLWNVAFSPFLSAVPVTALTLGLLLAVHRGTGRDEHATREPRSGAAVQPY